MGKGTDKLYITHSEWSSADSFAPSRGANPNSQSSSGLSSTFRRLPYNYCAVSLQPFADPVCTPSGTIFDLTHILTWLTKHPDTSPIDGSPLKRSDLITLNYTKNEDGEYVDPVTYKVFTDNTHIVAVRHAQEANVFAWDTVERLNIKAKNWKDLLNDEDFSRKDIITLQDPQNIESRDFGKYLAVREGETVMPGQDRSVNTAALGNAAKILKAKEAVAKARADRQAKSQGQAKSSQSGALAASKPTTSSAATSQPAKKAYNAAIHTSGQAAASFTSTGVTPHTSNALALLSSEDYMLRPKRVTQKGYARLSTSLGDLTLELLPEYAPHAVWNFVQLAKKGYYRSTLFHRNIKNFMIQGGDPTGTGRGGESIWGKPFKDEFEGPERHSARGTVSMANKGKDSNTSQFFITYRGVSHLDRKHTIFARVVDGEDTLSKMERVEVGEKDRPVNDLRILDVVVYVDPFEEWERERRGKEEREEEEERVRREGGTADDRVTWTGKRIRGVKGEGEEELGVGKYLRLAREERGADEVVGEVEEEAPRKKVKTGGGFGNFDAW